jgi:DNA-formamidopyrimidine glycosylase
VARVRTTAPSYFFLTPPAVLRRRLAGRRFVELGRVGKYLVATLEGGDRLLLHLGMTGQLFGRGVASVRLLSSTAGASLAPERQLASFRPDRHTHLQLSFLDGGPEVYFRDARKFGKVQLLRSGEPAERLDRLGVDALAATGARLFEASRARRIPIKTLLLDQSVFAGVGNIYADEALFLARVRPTRRGAVSPGPRRRRWSGSCGASCAAPSGPGGRASATTSSRTGRTARTRMSAGCTVGPGSRVPSARRRSCDA